MSTAPDDESAAAPLGPAVQHRLRLPGPPGGRRDATIGSLAARATRFAAATARPVPVRRSLAGPGTFIRPNAVASIVAPPRWWTPREAGGGGWPPDALPPRALPRAVRRVPDEQTYAPGGISERLAPSDVRVRRLTETAIGGVED
jgi:hypothetical protein